MEQRISLITLGVLDLRRSRRFYEGLGWTASEAGGDQIVFFQLSGGSALALFPRDALAADARVSAAGSGFGGITLAHNVGGREQVNEVLDQAVTAGGSLLKPAEEPPWGGWSGYFADPDGHPWEVAWQPAFELASDGSIRV